MGQSKPIRGTALIVEDDAMQREMICLLLEESNFEVIECESAEAAELVLERSGGSLWLMMTDVSSKDSGASRAMRLPRLSPSRSSITMYGTLPLKRP